MVIIRLFPIIISLLLFLSFINGAWGESLSTQLQTIKNLCVKETEGADLTWELCADKAIIDESTQLITLDKPKLTYQLLTGEKIQLKGNSGTANLLRNKISVWGNIKATSNQGIDFETEALVWDAQKRIITTENSIHLTRSDMEFSGEGLHADIALKKLNIKKKVETIIY
ncbi:MAG: LPS export ABC transporter periplasmic protein LptC [bacterium]